MADMKMNSSRGSGTYPLPAVTEAAPEGGYTMKQHWKALAACSLMSLCPFQYGLDFGLIGPMQSMIGFLRVRQVPALSEHHSLCDNRSSATKMFASRVGGIFPPSGSSLSPRS